MDWEPPPIALRPRTPSPPPRIQLRVENSASLITPVKRKRGPNRSTSKKANRKTLEGGLGSSPLDEDCQTDSSPFTPSSSFSREDLFREGASVLPQEEITDNYQCFVDATLGGECAYYQLSEKLFVVNGWNFARKMPNGNWYHLDRTIVGNEDIVVCMCPAGRNGEQCFHKRFMAEFGAERFLYTQSLSSSTMGDPTVLFLRYEGNDESTYINLLSVPSPRFSTIKNRAVVEYTGPDNGSGTWRCNRDPNLNNCYHVIQARHSLQQHLQGDMEARDLGVNNVTTHYIERPVSSARNKAEESVSRLPIPPPLWARIKSDPAPPTIRALRDRPSVISIDATTASCSCQRDRVLYDKSSPTELMPCLIYGLTGVWQSKIEVQKCPKCRYRFVGPDCRDIGLFNWNNRVLLTHQLLEDYLNTFSASETPITAYVTVMNRRYQSLGSLPFLSHQRFGSAFFSYARLLQLNGDMVCPRCGPNPDAVIFDGVSLSFDQKNVQASLKPPSTVDPTHSTIRDATERVRHPQFISERALRKDIRRVIVGPSLSSFDSAGSDNVSSRGIEEARSEDSTDGTSSEGESPVNREALRKQEARRKMQQSLLDRFKLIPSVVCRLRAVDSNLGDLFESCFGVSTVLQGKKVSKLYYDLFIQISAEESALQMMNRTSLECLYQFLTSPDQANFSRLISIPALYQVLKEETRAMGQPSKEILGVCIWMYKRAEFVRQLFLVHSTDPANGPLAEQEDNWTQTGCFYEKPQIRYRPAYPRLEEDRNRDKGLEKKGGCRKYYNKYSARKLTGGIMVPWCSHSIAYGFHCIPVSEGRNDVFSALYTRWEKAPKVIVYDFACALQPYCMLREPEFFQDTLFVIDKFHEADHTRCCPSSFLSTYEKTDVRHTRINSSAGECGNNGLGRIRKSVRYMLQEHAIIFTKTFLSIWNRLRIIGMENISGSA